MFYLINGFVDTERNGRIHETQATKQTRSYTNSQIERFIFHVIRA